MRRRPWALVILAIFHFIAPIGNIAFNAVLSQQSILSYFVKAMSPEYIFLNWYIIVLPIIAGFAILACQKWSFFTYLISIAVMFFYSYEGYLSKSESLSLLPIILVYLINISVVIYFLVPAVRNIYFDRRMRWWEIQSRYHCDFKCLWQNKLSKEQHEGKISNISVNGLFLKSNELPKDKDIIQIVIPLNNSSNANNKSDQGSLNEALFTGEVIIHGQTDDLGFGFRFHHNKESLSVAQNIISKLDKKGKKVGGNLIHPEDRFSYWVRTLLTTGKGLIPKKEQ